MQTRPFTASWRCGLALVPALALMAGCGSIDTTSPGDQTDAPSARTGLKIPVTTRSDDALELYLDGRILEDRVQIREARAHYLKAIEHDRYFALAHLALAMTSTSGREFFESMERAVALSDVISEGERLMVLAQDAGVRGDPAEQAELLRRLVELYPDDERAHAAIAMFHGGRQEYAQAIEHFLHAAELAPDFSAPYNQLGYLYRALGRYEEAEKAFLKYIELIPDEPNPYDSYAELLMKVGRFDESIANYEKALSIKPDFVFSYVGIGHNLIFLDRADEARELFGRMYSEARTLAERRTAILWTAMSHVYEGDLDAGLEATRDLYVLAEKNDDPTSMAGDLNLMGMILLAAGEPEEALEKFAGAIQLVGVAGVPDDVGENNRRNFLYWKTRVELARGSLDDARSELSSYRQQVEARRIPFEQRRVNELAGGIALADGDPATALRQLELADQQDPRVLYLTAMALLDAGHLDEALVAARRVAEYNGLALRYAFVRSPALQLLKKLEAATGH